MTTRGELARGTRLGKYEIHGRLSVGGMAELYLASLAGQGGFRKFVALKRVLPSIAANEDFIAMFLDEARITASLSHANIAQVFELAEDPDTREPMLAMEFVAGQNLDQIIQRARKRNVTIPPEFSCRMAVDVLLALHYAHSFVEPATGQPMAVIHRDINPRNVMITYSGGTKIIDFGIAKARGRLNETSAGFVKGTLQYMAPEQVTAKTIDGRADLFAAAIVLYELLSGQPLFDAPSPAAMMSKVIHEPVRDLGDLVPSLPGEVVDVVMKGLQRDRDQRWQTGREFARALDRALPDSFDEQQMGELMAELFEDKIAVTRGLISAAGTASPSDLRLMTMLADEEAVAAAPPALGSEPPGKDATSVARPLKRPTVEQLAANERTEMNLQPVTTRPPAQPFPDSDKTIAGLPVMKRAPAPTSDSEKTIAGLPVMPERKKTKSRAEMPAAKPRSGSELGLYVLLAVLAVALMIGTVFLLKD